MNIKKIYSRLLHVLGRVNKFQSDSLLEDKVDLSKICENLIADLESITEESNCKLMQSFRSVAHSTQGPSHFNQKLQEDQALEQGLESLQLRPCSNVPVYSKFVPVHSWNLKFDGSNSVNAFLEQVDELRIARNVSKERLFDSAVDLFEGQTLAWYRAVKHRVNNWDMLVTKLREDFLPSNYDDELWEEIKSRKQGNFEKPTIFIAIMINLFHRLTKTPSDSEQLKYIMRNLQPYYASHLSLITVNSVEELITLCKKLEETKLQNSKFRGTAHGAKCLEPDLAYKQPDHKYQTSEVKLSNSKSSYNSRQLTRGEYNRLICWNCKTAGHSYRNCTKPTTTFCYRCGTSGQFSPTCVKCNSKNE